MSSLVLVAALLASFCSTASPSCSSDETCDADSDDNSLIALLDPPEKLQQRILSSQIRRNVIGSSEGIFVSIKTTVKYHNTRLPPILLTWLQNVFPSQVAS